jgi:hypothetical protein
MTRSVAASAPDEITHAAQLSASNRIFMIAPNRAPPNTTVVRKSAGVAKSVKRTAQRSFLNQAMNQRVANATPRTRRLATREAVHSRCEAVSARDRASTCTEPLLIAAPATSREHVSRLLRAATRPAGAASLGAQSRTLAALWSRTSVTHNLGSSHQRSEAIQVCSMAARVAPAELRKSSARGFRSAGWIALSRHC